MPVIAIVAAVLAGALVLPKLRATLAGGGAGTGSGSEGAATPKGNPAGTGAAVRLYNAIPLDSGGQITYDLGGDLRPVLHVHTGDGVEIGRYDADGALFFRLGNGAMVKADSVKSTAPSMAAALVKEFFVTRVTALSSGYGVAHWPEDKMTVWAPNGKSLADSAIPASVTAEYGATEAGAWINRGYSGEAPLDPPASGNEPAAPAPLALPYPAPFQGRPGGEWVYSLGFGNFMSSSRVAVQSNCKLGMLIPGYVVGGVRVPWTKDLTLRTLADGRRFLDTGAKIIPVDAAQGGL